MILFDLYVSFLKIGFTSFGGMSMIPLILEEMQIHNWMTTEDLSNLIGIAEMTPGPLGLNCATFAGNQTAGIPGCLVAVLGVLTPTLTLAMLGAVLFEKFSKSRRLTGIMRVIKPLCVAMIANVILTLSLENYFDGQMPDFRAVFIGIVSFLLLRQFHWSVPKVLFQASGCGILLYGVVPQMLS